MGDFIPALLKLSINLIITLFSAFNNNRSEGKINEKRIEFLLERKRERERIICDQQITKTTNIFDHIKILKNISMSGT